MALNPNLNVKFTPTQVTDINTALQDVTDIISTAVPNLINLDPETRQSTRGMSDIRYPYALRAVSEFGVSYPALNGPDVSQAQALTLLEFYEQLGAVENKLKELTDRVVDLKINCGWLDMKFTDDQYDNAKRYRSRNIAGADVVYEAQLPLYDRESLNEPIEGDS